MSPELAAMIHRCWARAAVDRPSFESISFETANLLERLTDITPRPPPLPELAEADEEAEWRDEPPAVTHSPSLEPTEPLEGASESLCLLCTMPPANVSFVQGPFDDEVPNAGPNEASPVSSESDQSFLSVVDSITSIPGSSADHSRERQPLPPHPDPTTPATGVAPLCHQPQEPMPGQCDTINTRTHTPGLDRHMLTTRRRPSVDDGYESPVPKDEAAAERLNEARYSHYLVHPYHTSLNLPRTLSELC